MEHALLSQHDTAHTPGRSPGRRRGALFALILLGALLIRLPILFTSQRCLRSDEAVVGMMAKHIVTLGERPVYLYGQPYGGGHAIVAYMAAPLFRVFGTSALLLTSVTMFFSVANAALFYFLVKRHYGRGPALLSALFLAVSPPVTYTSFLVNGATETIFLCLIALHLFYAIHFDKRAEWWRVFLLGLLCGAAFWSMDFAIAYPLLFAAAWLIWDRGFLKRWRVPLLGSGFAVGCAPVIVYDLLHQGAHFRRMLYSGGASQNLIVRFCSAFVAVWTHDLPGLFHPMIDDFPEAIPWTSWLQYAAFVAALIWALESARRMTRGRGAGATDAADPTRPLRLQLLPVLYVAIYIAMYCAGGWSAEIRASPRYFVPLYPFAALLMAQLVCAVRRLRQVGPVLSCWLAAVLVVVGAGESAQLIGAAEHREHRILTRAENVRWVARRLKERGIRRVRTPYEIQWRLIFESDGKVLATCEGISLFERYPRYAEIVGSAASNEAEPFAFVFRRDFAFARRGLDLRADRAANDIRRKCGNAANFWRHRLRRMRRVVTRDDRNEEFVIFYVRPAASDL